MNTDKTFAERHPKINFLIGLAILLLIGAVILLVIRWGLTCLVAGIIKFKNYMKEFVSSTDKVIVVAMITGAVSIVGVVISSIVAKIVEYRYNVKKYLYDKREEPYKQFIEMIYAVMEDSKKSKEDRMSEEEMIKMVSDFSKGLTLWGSNRVVKKWLKYRKSSMKESGQVLSLLFGVYTGWKDYL